MSTASGPHLTLTVSADTLRGDADGWPAELRGVGPIHPETARRIACDAALTVVAVAPPAEVVRRGRASAHRSCRSRSDGKRAPSRHTSAPRSTCATRGVGFRAAIDPPAWTDGHHIIHWPDGPTELDNLVSLCRTHHRRVHEQGWRIHIADGIAVVEPPP